MKVIGDYKLDYSTAQDNKLNEVYFDAVFLMFMTWG